MSKSSYKLNHNRYLGSEHIRSQIEFERERSTPTAKQKKFFRYLIMLCKQHNLNCDVGKLKTRVDYALAIDVLIEHLQTAGVDVQGNKKEATVVFSYKSDKRNNKYVATEMLIVKDTK